MNTYKNPILYADYSDPDVIRVGEDYYMVSSSFTYLPGVPVLHSRDLVHWELVNYCVRSLPFEKYNRPSHGSGTWAPSIRFHKGTFYVFIPLVDEGIMVARSRDPYGEFELNMLWEGKGWIDPCPLWDEDGKTYIVFAYANSRSGIKHRISVVEIDEDCRQLTGEPVLVFEGEQIAPTCEGPKFYKKDGYYYILMPAGGVAEGWQACLRSRSVYGPYEYRVVMHQGNTEVNGPHQGGWVTDCNGGDWFIHFQDVIELGRIIHLQPMCFQEGWPFIGQDQNGDGIGEPVREWRLPSEGGDGAELAQSDDFEGDELGLQWQWQANPNPSAYSLTARPGHLRLYCLPQKQDPETGLCRENLLWYAPNLLTQIPKQPAFTMTAKLQLFGKAPGDFGGIGLEGHQYGYIGLYHTDAGNELRCYRGYVTGREFTGEAWEECVFQKKADTETIWLRLELGADKKYRLGYSEDGESYWFADEIFTLERATWTGAKLCLWGCSRENRRSEGYCDVERVDFTF